MERAVAIKKLKKIFGDTLGYRVDSSAPTREEREAAQAAITPAIEARKSLEAKKNERCRAILAADAEYQALHAAHAAAYEEVKRLGSITRHYKITVGLAGSLFFTIKAEGDSWEEIIEKLTSKEKAHAG